MLHRVHIFGVVVLVVLLGACSPAAAPVPTSAPAKAPSTGAGAQTTPSVRVSGAVKSIAQGTVTLADGTSFTTTPQTRVTRLAPSSLAELKPGLYVAVTAKLQSDKTLLASIVNVFDESMRGLAPGQRPMTEGNLMTNATIDKIEKVEGDFFTVTWEGGSARVKLAPDGKVNRIVIGQLADIKEGAPVSASVVEGVAQSVSLQ